MKKTEQKNLGESRNFDEECIIFMPIRSRNQIGEVSRTFEGGLLDVVHADFSQAGEE